MGIFGKGRRWPIAGLCVLIAATAVSAGYFAYMRPSPAYRNAPQVRDIADVESRLAAAAASGRVVVRELGTVTYDGFAAPFWLVVREPGEAVKRRCFLLGTIHGNEPAGVECLLRFIERLAADERLYPDTAFDIIPLANPWGWAHNRRRNGDGFDLNRDFSSCRGQETRFVRDVLDGKRHDLALDFHEDGGATGFYLYQYAEKDTAAVRALLETLRAGGTPIDRDASMAILKVRDGLIRAPMWTLRCVQLARKLSIGNYLRLFNAPRVYTIETPSRLPLEQRVRMDQTALDHFLATAQ
ncbi:MAG TPA: DUF2817 domain-containing protein [Candidatus Hydrogenedentes bacterium]|nr:DUF2817 domain-containing protein [Candidatus Hydrogenedentota bacterium]HOV73746.1 DUF2817 domain-containing protein [Candidatus Hydrogenedentota bacterium]